jgi:hypothetical protein
MSPRGHACLARPCCRRVRGGSARCVSGMLAVLVTIGTLSPPSAEAQRPASPTTTAPPLWISDTPLDDGKRLLIVIDPTTRHAAVYQVDPVTGGMVLKSTRDISWDLRLDEFNAQEPKPATLRKMLEPAGRP